jgi:hypothetical protein
MSRATAIEALVGDDNAKGLETLRQEDALATGFLSRVLDTPTISRIKSNHASGASWQIWGCFCGYPKTIFTGYPGDPKLDQYFKRLNFGLAGIDGIAVEIAKTFGVFVTAAQGTGLEFWHSSVSGQLLRNTYAEPPNKPFWMWLANGAQWKTFDPAGNMTTKPNLFGRDREPKDLPTPKPPKWMTDAYLTAAPAAL